MFRWWQNRKKQVGMLLCVLMLVGLSRLAGAVPRPMSVQQQVAQSMGARYIQARQLARQGKLQQAVRLLEKMLAEAEDGPAAVPIRRKLSELYLKLRKPQQARKTLRVASGPASRPLAKSYHKKFSRYLSIQLKWKLKSKTGDDVSTQEREYRFVVSRQRAVQKEFALATQAAKVTARLHYQPGKGLRLQGSLQVGNKQHPIQVNLRKFGTEVGREQRRIRINKQVGNTKLYVKLLASLSDQLGRGPAWTTPEPPPASRQSQRHEKRRYRFAMRFRNAPLARVLKHLADMSGYKITFNGSLGKQRVVSLKIKAKLRKDLLSVACARLGLICQVKGEILRIEMPPTTPRTPPTPPAPSGGNKDALHPPMPPRR